MLDSKVEWKMISRRRILAWSGALPLLAPLAASVLSSACASAAGTAKSYRVDASLLSENQDSRVRNLVFHYTAVPNGLALEMLTQGQHGASAHYLVPDAALLGMSNKVYQLVPEERRAWHAGRSYWQGDRLINSSSIGIEIVNLGYPSPEEDELPLMRRQWFDFDEAQVSVVAQLAADIIARHQIPPHKVVGHSDVSPGRKVDPGPKFPWERLYRDYNIGAWPEREAVEFYLRRAPYRGDVRDLQKRLLDYGYEAPQTGVLDKESQDVVAAFQMHFRPARYDGAPDAETSAILDALLEKYFDRPRPGRTPGSKPAAAPKKDNGKGSDTWPLTP